MKLAVIGTGMIAKDALYTLDPIDSIEVTALFARPHSRELALSLAEKYKIKEVYTDYDLLLQETSADTVYIGLVNTAHFDYAKKALQMGKHVILEKPFTPHYEEALLLAELANNKGLYLFEAITVLHNDIFDRIKEHLDKLGQIRLVLCNYSQYSSRYDRYLKGDIAYAFDPTYYGGALYDINVYNIHYCVALFGQPKEIAYYPNLGYNKIDTSGNLVLTYEGFSAVCTAAKDCDGPSYVQIQGEKGSMLMNDKPNAAAHLSLTYLDQENKTGEIARDASGAQIRKTVKKSFEAIPPHHRMVREFTDFARIIEEKDDVEYKRLLEESLTVVKVVETAASVMDWD